MDRLKAVLSRHVRIKRRGSGSEGVVGIGIVLPWEDDAYHDSRQLRISVYLFRWKIMVTLWVAEYPDIMEVRGYPGLQRRVKDFA